MDLQWQRCHQPADLSLMAASTRRSSATGTQLFPLADLGYSPAERMGTGRIGWSSVALLLVGLTVWPAVAAPHKNDAKEVYEQATVAFGLGRYAEAARKYEEAFSLRPDSAPLYSAAQSYRLAGNKQRALELYRNCLLLYPGFANAEDARGQIATLQKEIDGEKPVAVSAPPPPPAPPSPPPPPAPVAAPPAAPPSAPPPATAALSTAAPPPAPPPPTAPPLVGPPAPTVSASLPATQPQKPSLRKAWILAAVGAVLLGGTVAVLLATQSPKYPDATFGTLSGN
jgi:tetratricopeptide (TPR) repeat protein